MDQKCKNCGQPIEVYKYSRHENHFCSISCQILYERNLYIQDWLAGLNDGTRNKAGDVLSNYIRNYLLEQASYKCTRCGWGKRNPFTNKVPLEIEHLDGNPRNNKPDNLKVLCPNCHSLTSTFRALNKGHGRLRK